MRGLLFYRATILAHESRYCCWLFCLVRQQCGEGLVGADIGLRELVALLLQPGLVGIETVFCGLSLRSVSSRLRTANAVGVGHDPVWRHYLPEFGLAHRKPLRGHFEPSQRLTE
jgi:hypothetical protein